MNDKKRVAIYIKKFKNQNAETFIYDDQLDDFIKKIQGESEWEIVETYLDEIYSENESNEQKRLSEMIASALKGEIDFIATFSISLFGLSRYDTIELIKILSNKGVGVLFYNEYLNTQNDEGKAFIEHFNMIIQNESELSSKRTKKRVKKNFQKGKAHAPTTYFLGYDTGEDGNMIVNEEEAKIVRRIFNDFLKGKGTPAIAKELSEEKIKTARGNTNWTSNAVYKMIKQEKYYGAVRTQKTVTLDPHSHKRTINRSLEMQYLIKNNHPAIIPEETFYLAHKELEKRKQKKDGSMDNFLTSYRNTSVFSNIFSCGECGRPVIRRKIASSRNGVKYHFPAWQCRVAAGKDPSFKGCKSKYVWEEEIENAFMALLYVLKSKIKLVESESQVIIRQSKLTDQEENRLKELERLLENIELRIHEIDHLTTDASNTTYDLSLEQITTEREKLQIEYEVLKSKKHENETLKKHLDVLLNSLKILDLTKDYTSFNEALFAQTVDKGIIHNHHALSFQCKCGIVRRIIAKRTDT